MGYPGDHGRSGGRSAESYDLNAFGAAGSTDLRGPADATPPHAYETVYDADPDQAADHPEPDMPVPGRRGATPPRRRNLPLLFGGGAVALVLLAAGGVGLSKLIGGGGGQDDSAQAGATGAAPSQPGSRPSPSGSPLPTGALGAMLKSRTTDPHPLTLREVFNRKAFTISGVRYVMTTWHATRACGRTAHGARLVAAFRAGGCNQVLRGTFARADGTLAGTIGIANLRTARGASITAKIANTVSDTYLKPLPGRGATRNLGNGIAFASAEARGHYVLLSWIQAPNGKPIPQNLRRAASFFQPNVTYGTKLGFALQYRGIAGKPYGR
ncbi:MAG TPA: hypothetical protein VFU43_18100 [Streptosporangiaceae bacterium]|nr:hypothetical protein [Streptosporangiaceae bacterium]